MTYRQALEKANSVRWKTKECGTHDCWCLMIVPEEPIKYEEEIGHHIYEEEIYIIGSGGVDKINAKHIVEVHNKSL